MSVSLLILAAGMGSRYGGLKQLDQFGPNGEILMEFSIYDAIRAGFNKVVFVIRKDIEQEFNQQFLKRLPSNIQVEYVFQELDHLTPEYELPKGRKKPWGTAHAVLQAQKVVHEPFAVINGDDFYGFDALAGICNFLQQADSQNKVVYAIAGYPLKQTLSDFGSVSRAVLELDSDDNIKSITERLSISRNPQGEIIFDETNQTGTLTGSERVSMNLIGFTPSVFDQMDKGFRDFLNSMQNPIKEEFLLPEFLNQLLKDNYQVIKMIKSSSRWFGVTYPKDKELVKKKIKDLIREGLYPENGLWKQQS